MTDSEHLKTEVGSNLKPKVKKPKAKNVLLTDRDVELLLCLNEHIVLSFKQIHEKFFTSRAYATSMNRLKRIEKFGLIERIKIPRLNILGRENAVGVVFQLTNRGRDLLLKLRPNVTVFEKCPQPNIYQMDHDLLISDIAEHFKGQYPDRNWINGRYLTITPTLRKIPDAILKRPSGGKAVAIELELNGKSLRRYREIVTILRSSADLEKVIFVTASTTIGRRIMSAIEGREVPEGFRFHSNFFEFKRLDECLKNQTLDQTKHQL